jgi:aconitase A
MSNIHRTSSGHELSVCPFKRDGSRCVLAVLGDSITTDHISAGNIKANSPAGMLTEYVAVAQF